MAGARLGRPLPLQCVVWSRRPTDDIDASGERDYGG
jgi:hypothetical protein